MNALDGPAGTVVLTLRRCPVFLRLVQDETTRRWDALDQLDDTPGPDERIHVYRRVEGTWSQVFLCGRGPKAPSGRHEFADYRHVAIDGERFRDTGPWREWVQSDEATALLSERAAAS